MEVECTMTKMQNSKLHYKHLSRLLRLEFTHRHPPYAVLLFRLPYPGPLHVVISTPGLRMTGMYMTMATTTTTMTTMTCIMMRRIPPPRRLYRIRQSHSSKLTISAWRRWGDDA
jgi:hypothetical protein